MLFTFVIRYRFHFNSYSCTSTNVLYVRVSDTPPSWEIQEKVRAVGKFVIYVLAYAWKELMIILLEHLKVLLFEIS